MLLVSGLYLLSQRSISQEQIQRASVLLKQYVKEFEHLYSLRFMSINVHQLVHYADVTADLGPLWVYSCYFLEDLNGKICHLFHGTRYIGDQLASAAIFVQKLSFLIDNMNNQSAVKSYCKKLQKIGGYFKVTEEVEPGIIVVGKLSQMHNPPLHLMFDGLGIRNGNFQVFHRLWMKGILYSAESYTRAAKRESSFVALEQDGVCLLGSIRNFVRHSDCRCLNNCLCQPARHICIIRLFERKAWEVHESANDVSLSYMSLVQRKNELIAVPVSNIKTLCFHLIIDDGTDNRKEYIMQRVNDLEAE